MTGHEKYRERFDALAVCVIIPTYNNSASLEGVIRSVLEYTPNVIVVNDGSTDETASILQKLPVTRVSYAPNRGKGWALRKGFEAAVNAGYRHAITIDSDGQHFASDLPEFIDKLDSGGDAIIIGARNMNQSAVPGKSSFGHKFSNFWFRVETGIHMPDTQSGYRLYPVSRLKDIRFYTVKYEFEIEVLVRAAWRGIPMDSVDISVFYPSKEQRVTHFRPFTDFSRISVLNTVLVTIAFLYIKPRDFIRVVFRKETWKRLYTDYLVNSSEPPSLKAISIGFGVFMGIIPIWGFQLIAAIFLAVLFKLNKPLVILAANISITPMIPIIIYMSFKMGAWMMGKTAPTADFNPAFSIETGAHSLATIPVWQRPPCFRRRRRHRAVVVRALKNLY
jgi:glycosyltransferase involved in cell wall biosynthesis